MRTINPWKVSTIALTLALGLVAGGSFVSPASGRENEHEHEHGHGHMRAALEQLRSAKKSLEQAAHDFGGHRAKALDLTKKAIDEVEDGIKFAEQHPKGEGQTPKGGGQTPKGGGQTPKPPQGQQPK
jgi:hypothetical protein